MMRILYLHGLESSNVGDKVDFLKSVSDCYAPEMDYTNPNLEKELLKIVDAYKPDFIIGSSMGGYVASLLGNYCGINYISFNPAIHSRSFDPVLPKLSITDDSRYVSGLFVLGTADDVIDPDITFDMVDSVESIEVEIIEGMGHRIPLNVLVDIYKKYLPTND